jgi:riboflavin synthase
MDRIGVVDTMFARYDMGAEALDELKQCAGFGSTFEVLYRTVPGFKDLAVECKRIIEDEGCHIVVALGMPGKADIDQVCAHEASQGIMQAQLMTSTHILEVFVHEGEEEDPARLAAVCIDRARKHAQRLLDALRTRTAEPQSRPGRAAGVRGRRAHPGLNHRPPVRPVDRGAGPASARR